MIVCYLIFTCSIGFICRRINRNASDHFRGGGNMLWWVGALSAATAGTELFTKAK